MVKKAGQNIGHTEWWSGGVAMLNGEQDKAKREGGAPRRPDIGDLPENGSGAVRSYAHWEIL
jgi:hypothetical protein